MDIEKVLDEAWVYLDCGREKPRIWGVDDDWVEFERMLLSEVERIRRR